MQVKALIFRIINKLHKISFTSRIFESKYGIKCYNQLIKSDINYDVLKCIDIDPANLYLGFDGLKDEYSFVGRTIKESPHYLLMSDLFNDGLSTKNDYLEKTKKGCLDLRFAQIINKKSIDNFKIIFKNKLETIREKECNPIVVYELDGKYFIADGKHRAALCALLNKNVKCHVISACYLFDSYRVWIYQKMLKKKDFYNKNIELFDKAKCFFDEKR